MFNLSIFNLFSYLIDKDYAIGKMYLLLHTALKRKSKE